MADYPHEGWGIERRDRFGFWRLISIPINTSRDHLEKTMTVLGPDYRAVPVTISRRLEEAPTPQEEAA